MNLKKNALCLIAATSISLLAGSTWAQDAKGGGDLLSTANGNVSIRSFTPAEPLAIPPDCQSFEGFASWDGLNDADNLVLDLDIGAGNTLTGVGWDFGIATVGNSWLSEVTIQHSDSTGSADPNAINLVVADGLDTGGDQEFSSGGAIVDFSDNGLPDITAGADGILRLQFFESFDDNADAIDADLRNAAAPQLCAGLALACTNQFACNIAVGGGLTERVPANNPWALALLILLIGGLGFVAIRRFA